MIQDVLFSLALAALQGQVAPAASAPVATVEPSLDGNETAEADIVEGNVVGAKKRALEEAFLRAVERVFAAELADAGLPPAGPLPDELTKLRATFATAGRRYVRSYRVVEEAEANGKFRVVIAPVVDRAFLRKQIEKARAPGVASPEATSVHVVAEGPSFVGPAVADALRAAGLSATPAAASAPTPSAFVVSIKSATHVDGEVRGAGLVATRCQMDVSVRRPGGSRDVVLPSASEWAFAAESPTAERACLDRLAPVAARAIAPAVHEGRQAAAARAIHVTLDVVEPVALERMLRRLRRVGTVTRHELRRIAVGVAELRVETNLSADALGKALIAALADELTLTMDQASTAELRMTLRMRGGVLPALGPEEPAEAQ